MLLCFFVAMPPLKNSKHEMFARLIAEGTPSTVAVRSSGILFSTNPGTVAVKASKMLHSPAIAERIDELKSHAASVTSVVTVSRVLEELANIGFANMADYVRVQEDGTAYVDLSKIDRKQMAAIAEVIVEEVPEGKGDNVRMIRKTRFKLHDKRAALQDLGKHLGIFKEKIEVTGANGGPVQIQNKVDVNLLDREERDMLRQLLVSAAERKAERDMKTIEHDDGEK